MSQAAVAGYCGRCGAPFGVDAGPFCGRCGNAILAAPAAAVGYTYPVVPSASVPAAQHKLSHTRLLLLAGGAIAALVIVITLVVVVVRPTSTPCGFTCGPRIGPRLLSRSALTIDRWGYTVEYDSHALSVAGKDENGVKLQAASGDGEVDFVATSGSDTGGAVKKAVSALGSSRFQNLQQIGPVRGAEIGFVNGEGVAYSASFVPPDGGGQAVPVGIVIISAAQDGVTITVTAFSASDTEVRDAPYGLDRSSDFDFPVSNTIWKGSS